MKIEFHEIASMFPLMEGAEFDTLVTDIKENGLLEPIWTYEGKILDGRNRYRACQIAGVEPRFVKYKGDNPLVFVVSKNLHRRHLSESQRAVIAAKIANMPQGARTDLRPSANWRKVNSQQEAAKIFNVSERTIQRVKAVEREAPELISEIESGKITAHKALKQIEARRREEERKKLAQSGKDVKLSDRWRIYHGDIRTIKLDKQYDFIITDPPYPKEYLPLWEVLAKRAKEWLKPSGLLVAMSGQLYLNQIYKILDGHLIYYWTACYLTPGQPTPLRTRQVNTTWKPILIYGLNNDYKGKIFGDVYKSPQPTKEHHDWEHVRIDKTDMLARADYP